MNGNWFLAAFRVPPDTPNLIAFTHVENHNFSCPGPYAEWNSGAVVASADDGVTWSRLGLAISDPQPCAPTFGGAGYSSVLQHAGVFRGYGGCTGYLSGPGVPGTWQRWKGGAFSSPGVNGSSDCLPGVPSNACCPIVTYNAFLGLFLMVYNKWGQSGTLYIAASADGVSWGASQILFVAAQNRSL